MEEMVQALLEQGMLTRNGAVELVKPLNDIRVPPTVQAILASRIDRLPAAEKQLLQALAVLGREFPSGLIRHVAGKSDDELAPTLAELQLAEFIYEQPALGDVEYTFKHALTQEVAYNSVLNERRRVLHERTARAIEALYADRLEDHLVQLAYHYDRSGNISKAVECISWAGPRALQQSAHSEAAARLTRALELVPQLPDTPERARQELEIAIALSWSLYITRGPQAPERERALLRARELCEQLGDNGKLMEVMLALALLRFNKREFAPAQELACRVLVLAQQAEAPAMLAGAHSVLGLIMANSGQLESAHPHLESAVEFFGPGPYRNFGELYYAHLAAGMRLMTLNMLGYPATALRASRELVAAARRLSDPVAIGYALLRNASLNIWLRSNQATLEPAEELLSISTEHGMQWAHAAAAVLRGSAIAMMGRTEDGIAQMREGISQWEASGGVPIPVVFASLAEALLAQGDRAEGLAAVAEGMARAAQAGSGMADAELLRVKGELMMINPPNEAEAERCFRAAIDIARHQKARWWELRATASLAHLLKSQGKTGEAHSILSEIYNWFTEGFEFADLKDAKALLDELGA
jgi:tetratricopeptide (TPR) repeat protein